MLELQKTAPNPSNNVVIIGGGFAGAVLAKSLERRLPTAWSIYLLSQDNFITYNPLLAEVVGASVLPGHVVAPLRQMLKRTRIRMVKVTGIDVEQKRVNYLGEGSGSLGYGQLVLAYGVNANLDFVKGMAGHGLPLKTVGDALFLRNRIIARLEQATIQPNRERRRWLTTFIIVGGGFSGVEVAGELFDFLCSAVKYYKNVTKEDCRVVLLQGADRLLPDLSPSLGKSALRLMRKRGIDVCLNAQVAFVDNHSVRVCSGEVIRGGTVVCTVGTAPHRLSEGLPFPKDRGRIQSNPDMSIAGFPGVWALGDCAIVPNAYDDKASPPTAQFADRQARQLASNIVATTLGRPTQAFYYRPKGQLASIGHNKAVVELFGLRLSGFVAWLLWRGVYLLKVPTFARKVRLFLEWNWAMFFPPDIAHLGYGRSGRVVDDDQRSSSSAGLPEAIINVVEHAEVGTGRP